MISARRSRDANPFNRCGSTKIPPIPKMDFWKKKFQQEEPGWTGGGGWTNWQRSAVPDAGIFLGSEFLDFSETFCVRTGSVNEVTCPHFCAQWVGRDILVSFFTPHGQNASKENSLCSSTTTDTHWNTIDLHWRNVPKTPSLHSSHLKIEIA